MSTSLDITRRDFFDINPVAVGRLTLNLSSPVSRLTQNLIFQWDVSRIEGAEFVGEDGEFLDLPSLLARASAAALVVCYCSGAMYGYSVVYEDIRSYMRMFVRI